MEEQRMFAGSMINGYWIHHGIPMLNSWLVVTQLLWSDTADWPILTHWHHRYAFLLAILVYDHTMVNTRHPVRSAKLSTIGRG